LTFFKEIGITLFGFRNVSPKQLPSPLETVSKWGNKEKCHAEFISASNKIRCLGDPETSSG
jgi:hypothetical protein